MKKGHILKDNRKQRARINYIALFTRIFLAALVVAGLVFGVKLLTESSAAPVQTVAILPAEPSAVVLSAPATPRSAPQNTDAAPEMSVQTHARPKAEGYLVLVNWDHPTSGERPQRLIKLADAFGDEVALTNGEGMIEWQTAQAARKMFQAAQAAAVGRYKITSAYRSVSYQEQLFEARRAKDPDYGSDPYNNPVKVMPGRASEHTTGLALDILSEAHETANDVYGETDEGKWLAQNAHKYGFILRYPQDKQQMTGVIYEPWHYRYVGKEAAKEIFEQGLCLEEYVDT